MYASAYCHGKTINNVRAEEIARGKLKVCAASRDCPFGGTGLGDGIREDDQGKRAHGRRESDEDASLRGVAGQGVEEPAQEPAPSGAGAAFRPVSLSQQEVLQHHDG